MPFFVDEDGNVFRFVDNGGTVPGNLSTGTENYTINLESGNYIHEIKGDFVQTNVIEIDIEKEEEE